MTFAQVIHRLVSANAFPGQNLQSIQTCEEDAANECVPAPKAEYDVPRILALSLFWGHLHEAVRVETLGLGIELRVLRHPPGGKGLSLGTPMYLGSVTDHMLGIIMAPSGIRNPRCVSSAMALCGTPKDTMLVETEPMRLELWQRLT